MFVVGEVRDAVKLIFDSEKIVEVVIGVEFGGKLIDGFLFGFDSNALTAGNEDKDEGDDHTTDSDDDASKENVIAKLEGFDHFVLNIGDEINFTGH